MTACSSLASAARVVRFVVVDPETGAAVNAKVSLREHGKPVATLRPDQKKLGQSQAFDLVAWRPAAGDAEVVAVPIGTTVNLRQQNPQVPTKEITIRVTATRIAPNRAPVVTSGSDRTREEISKFVNTAGNDTRQLTKGQAGVAEDSAGQTHIRGEHADETFVVDGVQLPDTLSGRQGSVVVPSTIQDLQIILGGFAAQFGGQTAAVLNITTLANVSKEVNELTAQGGSFQTFNGDITSMGPLGPKANYVLDLNANTTDNFIEPQQPDNQTAHNMGSTEGAFLKIHFNPSPHDALTLTTSANPLYAQLGNRTGLLDSFAFSGEGYGFLGERNADGTIAPGVINPTGFGSQKMLLPSQQAEGMDIDQREIDEFGVLSYQHTFDRNDVAQLAVTVLHSGQNVYNNNPEVNLGQLPVDNSIEFNPTATRNVHHVQVTGSMDSRRGAHDFGAGFLFDQQSGVESYQIIPASQLALDELAALDSTLVPAGVSNPFNLDVNGNPVYTLNQRSPIVAPTVMNERSGHYAAGYIQDTWRAGHLTANYGLRLDDYFQHESISPVNVDLTVLSPRANFDFRVDRKDDLRWSYNHILNTPPLAEGAIVGAPIQPEIIDQYDVAVSRQMARNQLFNVAYYYKDIRNQVDTGLLVPGSEIGLFSAVNFTRGSVHGLETTYDITAPRGIGWDEYLNWTYSIAKPGGVDNAGAPVPEYNDHDQRNTIGAGLAYTLKSGLSLAGTFQYNSGLASSPVPPDPNRIPRTQLDLHMTTGDRMFHGHGGLEADVLNVFDSREVINFESGFSGTRFQQARRFIIGANFKF